MFTGKTQPWGELRFDSFADFFLAVGVVNSSFSYYEYPEMLQLLLGLNAATFMGINFLVGRPNLCVRTICFVGRLTGGGSVFGMFVWNVC